MCRGKQIAVAALVLFTFSGTTEAQGWNPFAKKSPPNRVKGAPANPFSLDHLLTIPGLTQSTNRPINQASLKDRFQQTTQQMWEDTKQAITPPILQENRQGAGGIWPFAKGQSGGFKMPNLFPKNNHSNFTLPNLFPMKTASVPKGPPPTMQEFLAQPRPE